MMKKLFSIYFFLFSLLIFSQTDYSDSWEDFYSYNNVKDFVKVENVIYALADNAVFTFDINTEEINKLSSVQGLSGETTTSIHYNKTFKRLIIGYENGLIEIIDEDNTITISSDIVNFNESAEKSINDIAEFDNKLYLSTPFAIVVYDIEKLEFGDTYFIGNSSSSIKINQIVIFNKQIYAATEEGVFIADVTSTSLIDFNNWKQNFSGRNYTQISIFKNKIYITEDTELYQLDGVNLITKKSFSQNIIAINASSTHLAVSLIKSAIVFDSLLNEVVKFLTTSDYDFNLNNTFFENNAVFLATKEFGILSTELNQPAKYIEIHPEGPLSNNVFSITVQNNNIWVVFGGYNGTYTPIGNRQGYSHFNGEKWINTSYNPDFPVTDLVNVTIDPNNENKVYISSVGDTRNVNSVSTGGLMVVENDIPIQFYNHLNSSLEDILPTIPNRVTIRISGTAFDRQGNLWITNYEVANKLKKLSSNGQWSSVDLSVVQTNKDSGLNEVFVDRNNTIWVGTRRNGVYIYNENGNRKKALIASPNLGDLPDPNVRTVAIDANNRVWLGTKSGMVVYNNASGVFDDATPNAQAVVINGDENGFGERLLGDQTINSIAIDGADNKWFGTDNGGVLYTNSSGQNTLANFSKQNSPLPSNRILKIKVDDSNGKVYFATDKGIVAYNSKVAPFGEELGAVYAYPNPALKNHETITIDGRNGTHLPKGTNVKILDVAGNLVYETNVIEGQELQGGKVVWNKKNLAGNKVASGIYIVLLSNDDASETAVTKIAIVN